MKTTSGNTRPTRTAQVNAYLASHGFPDVTLHKGAGYFYFSGPDVDDWRGTSVMVPYLGDLTLAAWLEEAHMLAGSARKNPRRRAAPRRRKNGLLGAVGLLGLGFAGGAYLESEKPFVRRLRERSRGPAKPAVKALPAPAPAKRSTTTDPAWRRERNQQGKGYSHLRTINGVDYEVWERIYSDGGKAIFLEAGDKRDRIYAPNGEEDGWVSVAAAKKAAEADAKTRTNPRRRK